MRISAIERSYDPRDMIKFCNEVLSAYSERHGDVSGKFDNEAVIAARDGYSEYLLRELDDEIAKHNPTYQEYLEVLKSIGNIHFTSSQFASGWEARPRLAGEDWRDGLESLFEFSVIGYLKSGGGGGGSKYVWRYLDPRARFDGQQKRIGCTRASRRRWILFSGGRGSPEVGDQNGIERSLQRARAGSLTSRASAPSRRQRQP